uniref:protein-tyrosine-phosphatase n=1 Tax=Gallus gallus TaxID=9031 RepID=A0A8V1A976_CHICK
MVQACSVCHRAHNSSLTARVATKAMDKADKPSPSAKKHVRLQERRGSNVSLVLDMSSLGSVEPIQPVCTPRDITLQFLRTSSHVLRTEELQQRAQSLAQLQEEFSILRAGCASEGQGVRRRTATSMPTTSRAMQDVPGSTLPPRGPC